MTTSNGENARIFSPVALGAEPDPLFGIQAYEPYVNGKALEELTLYPSDFYHFGYQGLDYIGNGQAIGCVVPGGFYPRLIAEQEEAILARSSGMSIKEAAAATAETVWQHKGYISAVVDSLGAINLANAVHNWNLLGMAPDIPFDPSPPEIAPRDLTIVHGLAAGRTIIEIGRLMKLSHDTIQRRIAAMCGQLGLEISPNADRTTGLVHRAHTAGLLIALVERLRPPVDPLEPSDN